MDNKYENLNPEDDIFDSGEMTLDEADEAYQRQIENEVDDQLMRDAEAREMRQAELDEIQEDTTSMEEKLIAIEQTPYLYTPLWRN